MPSPSGRDWYAESRIRSLEGQVAKLESELHHLQLTQIWKETKRDVTFWLGLAFFSSLATMIFLGWYEG
jgi:hypothetical protein